MKQVDDLRKEISEILSRPQPWGPMMIPRVIAALRIADDYMSIINDLDDRVKYYEKMRSDVKLSRNIMILKEYDRGISYRKLAKRYDVSAQRIHKIVSMTRKYLEEANGTQAAGLSGKSDTFSEGEAGRG